jgi:molybdate transport system ATP-binding protein
LNPTPENLPHVCCRKISVRISGTEFFHGLDWTLSRHEHWALVGPNGAGKSLLANLICKRLPLSEGRIEYFFSSDGNPPDFGSPFFKPGEVVRVGMEEHQRLMQWTAGYHQSRWQSLDQDSSPQVGRFLCNQAGPADLKVESLDGDPQGLRRMMRVLGRCSGEHLLERRLHTLSNGETRRILLAAGLIQEPRLLILDDPFAGLDDQARQRFRQLLEQLLESHSPQILFISPRLEELPDGVTHLLWLENHGVKAMGPKTTVLSRFSEQEVSCPGESDPPPTFFPWTPGISAVGSTPLVEINHANVKYQNQTILSDVTFHFYPDENWAILGPNGAGKTTLLSLILADNPQAYSNDVSVFGKKRGAGESIWEIKQQIGWVAPELQAYYPRTCTCEEVVLTGFFDSMGLFRRPSARQYETAHTWMEAFEILPLTDQLFQTLSAGEQRLALLCRAMVKSPRLLVLDEAFQGLDLQHRIRLKTWIEQLCRQTGVNLICVSHHPEDLPSSITHVLYLEGGRVISIGKKVWD